MTSPNRKRLNSEMKKGINILPAGLLENVREIIMAQDFGVRNIECQEGGALFEITAVEFAN